MNAQRSFVLDNDKIMLENPHIYAIGTGSYELLKDAEMLVIASPIYYHGISGQLKCVIDRFYSAAYPQKPEKLKKVAMILSSGDADMYDGTLFSFKGDFLDYLGLENMGVFTSHGAENDSREKAEELRAFGASLK